MRGALLRAQRLVLLPALLVAVSLALDHIATVPAGPVSAEAPAAVPTPARPPRLYVLIVDSLRYETAIDPQVMPALVGLRPASVHGKMRTVFEAFSGPAIRAAFAGEARPRLLSLVSNFYDHDRQSESVLKQLTQAGRQATQFSGHHFQKFEPYVEDGFFWLDPGEDWPTFSPRLVRASLRHFETSEDALVVGHVHHTDFAAHEYGVDHPEYRRLFRLADDLVAEAARRVPPEATLLVMGDHGHDARGAHLTGTDVPTFVAIRGPGLLAGLDLGTFELPELRYFMSFALGLPVDRLQYDVPRLSRALADPTAARAYAAAVGPDRPREAPSGMAASVLVAVWIGVVALVAAAQVVRPLPGRVVAAAWVAVLLLAVPMPASGLAACGVALAASGLRQGWRRVLVASLAGAGVLGVGALLAVARLEGITLQPWTLAALWLGVGAVAVAAVARVDRHRVTAAVAALALVVLFPAQHLLGFPREAPFVPLLLLWWLLFVRDRAPHLAAGARPALFGSLALAAAVGSRLLVYADVSGASRFLLAVPTGYAETVPIAVLSLLAKAYVFRHLGGPGHLPLKVAVFGVTVGAQWILWPKLVPVVPEKVMLLAWLPVLAAAWAWRRQAGDAERAHLLGVGTMLVAYYAFVRSQTYHYAWGDLALALLLLAARQVRAWGDPRRRARDHAVLQGLALVGTYEVTIAWPGGLEWQALYDWFHPALVEEHVALFVPWIAARLVLPFLVARALLAEQLGPLPLPHLRRLRSAALLLVAALLGVTVGVAIPSPAEGLHLWLAELAAEALGLSVMGLQLPGGGRTVRRSAGLPSAEVSGRDQLNARVA